MSGTRAPAQTSPARDVEWEPPIPRKQFNGPRLDQQGRPVPGVLPDFLILGAQKAGTSSLHSMLSAHPQIFLTKPKETHFFDGPKRYARGLDWYRSHFPPQQTAERHWVAGETTPAYLYLSYVPERVAAALPEAKLIVVLRNPVDRAFSHWAFFRYIEGKESLDLEPALRRALDLDRQRAAGKSLPELRYSYVSRGYYADQLERWWQLFPRERTLVLDSRDLRDDATDALARTQQFLGLPALEPPRTRVLNPSRGGKDQMTSKVRAWLGEHYRPHNARLYELLGRDFGWD